MRFNFFASILTMFLMQIGVFAEAACTAANPNANVAETTPTSGLTDNGDGTITDTKTGLMWKQCSEGQSGAGCATGTAREMIWEFALQAASTSLFAGHGDWRLPNIRELASIRELCGYNPSINQIRFPGTRSSLFDNYWSSSSYALIPDQAWRISFGYGNTSPYIKSATYYVRLVRGGQSSDAFDVLAPAVPGAPTINNITSGPGSATINFTAPANSGGAPILGYVATCAASGLSEKSASALATPIKISGLRGGVTYTCSVAAMNSSGTGPSSQSLQVVPSQGANMISELLLLLD
jgi:hypothetical protein